MAESEIATRLQETTIEFYDNSNDGEKSKKPISTSPFSDVVYQELAILNGQVNKMNRSTLSDKVRKAGLSTDGTTEVLRKRLKNYYKTEKLSNAHILAVSKLLPYYVVVDFEATCQEFNGPEFMHEIIEFPAVLVKTETQEVVDHFQAYCRPTLSPMLSEFCIALTGITQDQIDSAETFVDVLESFKEWLKKHKLGSKHKFAFVTDGPWDMGRFLSGQCNISDVRYPSFAKKWINIRKSFGNFYKTKRYSLQMMLDHLGMKFEGRPHSGLDDSRNIAAILIRMMSDGALVQPNERIRWQGRDKNQAFVVSLNPPEKIRDIKVVKRERSKMKDPSIFLLSDTDSEDIPSEQTESTEPPTTDKKQATCHT